MSHPNLTPLHEIIIDPNYDQVLIVSDCFPFSFLWESSQKNTRLGPTKIWRYFRHLVSGLEYCHTVAGIVHRGIRLENIWIKDAEDVAQLAEAGQAFLLDKEEGDGVLEYNAPELLKEGGYKSAQSDIWALGICLYYMTEGAFPFSGSSIESVKLSILTGKLQFRSVVDPSLRDLLEKMLTKDPSKRITLSQLKVCLHFLLFLNPGPSKNRTMRG